MMSSYRCRQDYKLAYPKLRSKKVLRFLKKSDRQIEYDERDIKVGHWVYDPETGVKTYVPAVEVSLDYLHENGRPVADPQKSIEDTVADDDMHERLHAALAKLNAKDRRLIKKLFFDMKSESAIAETAGIHQSSVHRRKKKVLKKLRKMLL